MAVVIAILGLCVLAQSLLNPILPLYLTSINIAPDVLGVMFSVGMIGMAIGESTSGWIADRVGIRLPFSLGTFISGATVLLFVLTQQIPAIFTIFFFWGLFRSALFGPGRGYIGTNAPPLKKATFMGIIAALMSASRSFGALPSGFIADTWGFNIVFFVSCGVSLSAGLLMVIGLRKDKTKSPAPSDTITSSVEVPRPQDQKLQFLKLTPQCIVTSLCFLGLGILITFLPLLATQRAGVDATEVGILFTIGGTTSMVLGIPMGMMADRLGKKTFMILGLLVLALSMVGLAYSQSFLWLIVFAMMHSVGMVLFGPAALGMLSDSVPLERQSTAMGLYGGVCENGGIIAGSALGGLLWSNWGPQVTFITGAIASGIGAVICFSLVRERHR